MSKAIKCDRCGRCFTPESLGATRVYCHFSSPVIINAKAAVQNCFTDHFKDSNGNDLLSVDLCDSCTDVFIDFMEQKERIKKE